MRAAVFHEAGKPLTIETLPDPTPADGEVVIAVHGAGICGSDLHMTQHPGITRPGTVLGHEFAGTIAALGKGISGTWKIGDRVTALPLFPCCGCEACDAHMPNLCSLGNWAGVTPERPGAYAEYVVARGNLLQAVPAGVGDPEAAMIEPLAVAHHTVARAAIRPNEDVLIMGGGPIGAAAALFARAAGARNVIVSEPAAARRERCALLGATATVDPLSEDVGARFSAHAGRRPDVVIECVGAPGLLHQAVNLVGLRGRVVVAGVLFEEDHLPPLVAFIKEVTIIYSQAYTERDFTAVIDALAQRKIDAAPMHTRTVGFLELPTMFDALRGNPQECKVLIDPR
jgi:(R,R)-butanediol dehydrogenase/meso-butanediol dehydrogenase/diacetyl reductase